MSTSSSSYNLADLLDDTAHKLKVSYKNADPAVLSIVWGHTCIFIEEQLVRGKAVALQGLGTFSYINKKQDLGNKGVKATRTPVFVVADAFCAAHDLRKDTTIGNLTASVPMVSMNNSLIASQSDTNRDIVIDFHKDIVRCIGMAVRDKKSISIEVKNIGTLIYSAATLKATFNSDFIAQIQVTGGSVSSPPTKNVSQVQLQQAEDTLTDLDVINASTKSGFTASLSPVSRTATPRLEDIGRDTAVGRSGPIILQPMESRPKNPYVKIRANSDSALRPLSAFRDPVTARTAESHYDKDRAKLDDSDDSEEECDDETCEHCMLAAINARAARLKHAQERQMEEATLKAQRIALQAIEDKEALAVRLQKARREEADLHNRSLLSHKQDAVLKQKNMDFYGDVFYARRPGTPESVKKERLKNALEDQITDKQQKTRQTQVEIKKEHEIFHETQKQADERARRLKLDEKQRLKDHSEFLIQQMAQKTSKPKDEPLSLGVRFDRSIRPGTSGGHQTPTTFAEDVFRPATADIAAKRRSFDTNALENNKESIQQKRQRELDAKATEARHQAEIVRLNNSLKQQQIQEELNKKHQQKEVLRNAWDSQIQQRRTVTIHEINQSTMPQRASLDIGVMTKEKKRQCKNCGRGMAKEKAYRRSSGDYRLTDGEVQARKSLVLG